MTYEVTAETVPAEQESTGNVVDGVFSIPLAVGYKWRITATMKANINGTEVAILTDTYEMSEALTAENPILTHDFVLKPIVDGVGNINLSFSGGGEGESAVFNTVELVSVKKKTDSGWQDAKSDWEDVLNVDSNGISMKSDDGELKSALYEVTLVFKKNNIPVYFTTQSINVFNHLTTNTWVTSYKDADGKFQVTQAMVDTFKLTNLFVGDNDYKKSEPSNNNVGSPYAPLADLEGALSRIQSSGDSTKDYTIHISGSQTGNFTIGSEFNSKIKSLTLCGIPDDREDSLNGNAEGTVLTIGTTKPITIKNLKITGGKNTETSSRGGGIYMGAGSKVTLESGALIGDNASSVATLDSYGNIAYQGAGIYNDGGSLSLKNGSSVCHNCARTQEGGNSYGHGGGIYNKGELTIEEGAKVSYNCGMMRGGGIYFFCAGTDSETANSVTVTGGEISNNEAGYFGGGVFLNGEDVNASVFTMSGGSISDNKTTSNNEGWVPAAGGVFLDNYSKFVMSGTASIKNNSTILDSAGVKVNTQTDTFEMNGGVIFGNKVGDGSEDGKITGIHVAGNFKISGKAYIASDNNLYLEEGKSIIIAGALTPPAAADRIVATITPHSYERTDALLVVETGVTLANESGKFAVTDNDTTDTTIWTLDPEGKLLGAVPVSNAVTVIQGMSGANNEIAVAGAMDQSSVTSLVEALGTAYNEDNTTRIKLDLSSVTGFPETCPSFDSCAALSELILPEGLKRIASTSNFGYCNNLTRIYLPASVESIDGIAFYRCPADIDIAAGNTNFTKNNNAIYSDDGKKLVAYCNKQTVDSEFTVPATVEEICPYAFCSSNIKSITFESPSALNTIGMFAFEFCKKLVGIDIPDSVTTIGESAFCYCSNLATISLPAGLEVVPAGLFSNGTSLTSITIPNGVKEIKTNAFWVNSTLQTITIPASLEKVEDYAFGGCNNLKTVNYKGSEAQRAGMEISEMVYAERSNITFTSAVWYLPEGTDGTVGTSGNYILFGEYPQTIKASEVTVDVDNKKTVGSFTYLKGSDGAWYVARSQNINNQNSGTSHYSDNSTPGSGDAYFKVEPIKWRILDANFNNEKTLVLSERILAASAFGGTSWDNSTIQTFLNGNSFLNSAFTSAMQNRLSPLGESKAFILESSTDFVANYALDTDSSKVRKTTDYALASCVQTDQCSDESKGGCWWVRDFDASSKNQHVNTSGGINGSDESSWAYGVVPALFIANNN